MSKTLLSAKDILKYMESICPWPNNKEKSAVWANRSFEEKNSQFELREIPIDSIFLYFIPHSKRSVKKYQKLIEAGSLPPPVVLGKNYSQVESIYDGSHRIHAMKAANKQTIMAYIEI